MAQQALPNFFLGNITKGNSFEVLPLNWCVYQHQHQLLVKYQESVIATSSLFFWCFFTIYKTLCNKSEEYYLLNHCKGLKNLVTSLEVMIFSSLQSSPSMYT